MLCELAYSYTLASQRTKAKKRPKRQLYAAKARAVDHKEYQTPVRDLESKEMAAPRKQ